MVILVSFCLESMHKNMYVLSCFWSACLGDLFGWIEVKPVYDIIVRRLDGFLRLHRSKAEKSRSAFFPFPIPAESKGERASLSRSARTESATAMIIWAYFNHKPNSPSGSREPTLDSFGAIKTPSYCKNDQHTAASYRLTFSYLTKMFSYYFYVLKD